MGKAFEASGRVSPDEFRRDPASMRLQTQPIIDKGNSKGLIITIQVGPARAVLAGQYNCLMCAMLETALNAVHPHTMCGHGSFGEHTRNHYQPGATWYHDPASPSLGVLRCHLADSPSPIETLQLHVARVVQSNGVARPLYLVCYSSTAAGPASRLSIQNATVVTSSHHVACCHQLTGACPAAAAAATGHAWVGLRCGPCQQPEDCGGVPAGAAQEGPAGQYGRSHE